MFKINKKSVLLSDSRSFRIQEKQTISEYLKEKNFTVYAETGAELSDYIHKLVVMEDIKYLFIFLRSTTCANDHLIEKFLDIYIKKGRACFG